MGTASGGISSSFTRGRKCGGPCRYSASETNCDKIVLRIFPPMRHIPVAHRLQRRLRFFGVAQVSLHLGADIEPLRVGSVQIRRRTRTHSCAVSTAEQGLARIQRDGSILRRAERRQQPHKGRHDASSQDQNPGNDSGIPPAGWPPDGHDPKIGGEHLQFKGLCAEGQTVEAQLHNSFVIDFG